MSKSIRFNYLYRDSGNYKTFGFKDFANPNNFSLKQIQNEITKKLISSEFFYPEESGIEKFEFHRYGDDYSWYEFESVEVVNGKTPEKTINEFIAGISTNPDV
jgi:hypothetical protein